MQASRRVEHESFMFLKLRPGDLFSEEEASQVRFCDETASLPKNGVECASVDLLMIWNGERLRLAVFKNAANFDVTAALRDRAKAQLSEDG